VNNWKYEYSKRVDKFNLWLARLLPSRLAYWCFIRVFAESGNNPDELGFKGAADYWTDKYGIE